MLNINDQIALVIGRATIENIITKNQLSEALEKIASFEKEATDVESNKLSSLDLSDKSS